MSDEPYHGIPPIRAPHWRWLVITYFWVGGIAGGASAVAALADLFTDRLDIVRAGRYTSFLAVAAAPVLLILDLGRPARAFHMFRILKLKSPMSIGSWTLLLVGTLASILAAVEFVANRAALKRFSLWTKLMDAIMLPLAFLLAGYTGVLLAATNVPVWARNHLLLGPVFLASGFSSALAAISIALRIKGNGSARSIEDLKRAEAIALVAETVLLLGGLVRLGRLGKPLWSAWIGLVFFPVTLGAGIIAPLALHFRKPGGRPTRHPLSPFLVLLGSFSLRAVMIFAGRESASRPGDYFEYTCRSAS